MRLICPNCGAQYEVPTEVIPETGRDVQCSNCGDTWFQSHPDHPTSDQEPTQEPEQTPESESEHQDEQTVTWDSPEDEETAPEPEPKPEPEPTLPPAPEPNAEDDAQEDAAPDGEDEDDSDTPDQSRRRLDPAIADVLREEAEHEREARIAEAGGLETQPDLGLTQDHEDEDRRSREARARMARLRGEPEEETPASDADDIDPSSRRNLLPDIDEINSSLDASPSAPKNEPPEPEPWHEPEYVSPKRNGFKGGFVFAVLFGAILLAVYAYAPKIAEMVPALSGPLEIYVEKANDLRVLIDEQFGWIREWLQDMSSPASGG